MDNLDDTWATEAILKDTVYKCTVSSHSVQVQCTFSAHSVNVQCTYSAHSVHMHVHIQ
jgi:hypothetical protein